MIVCSLMIGAAGCGATHSHEVMAIEKTKMYHREECPPVHMAKAEEMTVSEARARKFKPCPICNPDSE